MVLVLPHDVGEAVVLVPEDLVADVGERRMWPPPPVAAWSN